jgi:nicotinate-nucleotide adenylyltransferase
MIYFTDMIKTGLLFGSFNPIHIGHVAIAGYMKEFECLDEVWFVVSPRNPFKSPRQLVSPAARLEMTRLAVMCHPAFRASDVEFNMPLPSYTLHTLEKLRAGYPGNDFIIITGSDNIESIPIWRGGETLAREYKFLFYPRPGSENAGLSMFTSARIASAPLIGVSSSFIRESIKAGKDMRAFVPCETYDYIEKNGFYKEVRNG